MSIDEIRKIYYEQQGIEKGIEEGIEKRDIEIVLNMISEGLDEYTISKFTKIDINKVMEIKEKYKS